MQIGVFGAHDVVSFESCRGIAYRLGQLIGEGGHFMITGGSAGVSEWAAQGAKNAGGFVIGICPEGQNDALPATVSYGSLSVVIHTGMTHKLRNVISVLSSDVCVFIGGAYGTLNEFTIAIDYFKPCIVITGTGGVTEHIADIIHNLPPKATPIKFTMTADEAYYMATLPHNNTRTVSQ